MADVKTNVTTSASAAPEKSTGNFAFNLSAVGVAIAVAYVIYYFVLGQASNFKDAAKHVPANTMGTMYLGGVLVPILIAIAITLVIFVIERFLTIFKARGKMGNAEFIRKIQYNLANNNIDAAISECDKQAGSVGNVMKAGLKKYKEMASNTTYSKEQKIANIKKEVEETTALELPMMEKNLVFLSTISSIATLGGLFGTVLGMIKSFAAMSASGAPDANALAAGISEALINTALGIGTSFIAIIAYNFFTTIIDNVTYGIDESGFTLEQSFASKY
jgi:biopolymer transport protein ExbB